MSISVSSIDVFDIQKVIAHSHTANISSIFIPFYTISTISTSIIRRSTDSSTNLFNIIITPNCCSRHRCDSRTQIFWTTYSACTCSIKISAFRQITVPGLFFGRAKGSWPSSIMPRKPNMNFKKIKNAEANKNRMHLEKVKAYRVFLLTPHL